jgi:aryl-phospho-beta-D-glucosidase BglC (GH1 family)
MHASWRGKSTAVIWKKKQDMYILMNMHEPRSQGRICDEHGNVKETYTVAEYSQHMSNVTRGDRITNIYLEKQRKSYFFMC